MKKLKHFVRKILYKDKASSEDMLNYLRARGAQIGHDVTVFAPNNTLIDKTAPWLIKMGDYIRIGEGTRILTHDYAWVVLKRFSSDKMSAGSILGSQGPVEIGDNVFIGVNVVIVGGVKIGNNVVIGAGSIVTRDCEDNGVYVGSPARRIMDLEEFYERRKNKIFNEAKKLAIAYKERFSKEPPKEIFTEYFMLFSKVDDAINCESFNEYMGKSHNYDETVEYMKNNPPLFDSYEEFLEECYK